LNRSIDIGRLFGIRLRVHRMLLWLIAILVVSNLMSGGVPAAVGILRDLILLSVLVVLHEIGHALVARHFGVQVVDITLWPLGGMARMAELPEDPKVEAWVAVAGPAVNFALALVALPFLFLAGGMDALVGGGVLLQGFAGLLTRFVVFNLVLGTFNLIPAFPMDGGRILRAFLAMRSGWLPATERAVRVGRTLAWVGIVYGLVSWQPILILVSGFVLWAGLQELTQVRLRHAGGGFNVFDLFEAARRAAGGVGGARGAGANPGSAGHSTGWSAARGEPADTPATPPQDASPSAGPDFDLGDVGDIGRRGFSEEDVARLERFRGRLPGLGEH
jgi:stage IV sporulation protein FB